MRSSFAGLCFLILLNLLLDRCLNFLCNVYFTSVRPSLYNCNRWFPNLFLMIAFESKASAFVIGAKVSSCLRGCWWGMVHHSYDLSFINTYMYIFVCACVY